MKKFFLLLFVLSFLSANLYSQREVVIETFDSWGGGLPAGYQWYLEYEFPGTVMEVPGYRGSGMKLTDVYDQSISQSHSFSNWEFPIQISGKVPDSIKARVYSNGANNFQISVHLRKDAQNACWAFFSSSISFNGWITQSKYFHPLHIGRDFDEISIQVSVSKSPDNNNEWAIFDDITLVWNSTIHLLQPTGGEKWLSGEKETIRFSADDSTDILRIEYSTDGGTSYSLLADSIKASDRQYEWLVPELTPTTKARIKITSLKTNDKAESENFRMKPYIITRLDNNGDYITYDINIDRWNYGNNMSDMFPYSWWFNKFDYQNGIDPFTDETYPQTFLINLFSNALRSDYPDWISFVNAFSVNTCYVSTSNGVYSPTALLKWLAIKRPWGGSCFGIANANALAFSKRNEFINNYPYYPNFADPINVQSDTNVVKVITELFTKQFGRLTTLHHDLYINTSVNKTLHELKLMLKEDNTPIRTLFIKNNTPNTNQAHAVLPYKLKHNPDNEFFYDLWVWDNSYPNNTNAIIRMDTIVAFGKEGLWYPLYGWNGWGGGNWFFLEPVSDLYLNDVSLPKTSQNENQLFFPMAVEIDVTENANILITDSLGNSMGYQNNSLITEIPHALPLIYVNGSEGPPYGYLLGIRGYTIELNNFTSDTVETYFFTDNKAFSYERYDADEQQTDDLLFDGGIEVNNQDEAIKSIRLMNIVDGGDDERVFIFRGLHVSKDESIKITNPDAYNLDLISKGSSKTYEIELNHATELGLMRFNYKDVEISANTTHRLKPNWGDFAALRLEILVDEGNDGTIDDTLHLEDQGTGVEEHGSNTLPTKYGLEQNYPNPFNPSTIIKYSIPSVIASEVKQSQNIAHVVLKVYDILGREVATLVNEQQKAGNYEVEFDASNLTSGIYFYRIQAGDFVDTKKMILMK